MTAEIVRQATLQELEQVIDDNLHAFVRAGMALMEVRDRKLYEQAGYVNFEMYCHGRWGFTDRRGRQLIDAAKTVQKLEDATGTIVPVNEAHAREIAPLVEKDPEAARAVLRDVSSQNQHVTASKIREAVTQHFADHEQDDPVPELDPRIDDLKQAIRILERCQRARSDVFTTAFRVMAGEARKVLRDMEAEGI